MRKTFISQFWESEGFEMCDDLKSLQNEFAVGSHDSKTI